MQKANAKLASKGKPKTGSGNSATGSADGDDSGSVQFSNPLAAMKGNAEAPMVSDLVADESVRSLDGGTRDMVERTRALEAKRRRAYRRQSMRSAKIRGKQIEGREERELRMQYSLDYNRLESSLLSASIFVCLCGVMFASNRFEDDDHFVEQRDALTYICIMVIVLALIAVFLAFLYEVVVGFRPEARQWFLTWLVYTGKIPPSHDEDENDKIQLQSAVGADLDADDDTPALTQPDWEKFRGDYAEA